MASQVSIVIKSSGAPTAVKDVESIGDAADKSGLRLDDMVKKIQLGAVAVSAAGGIIEAYTRSQQEMNTTVGQTAAAMGITEDAFRDMAVQISNAGLPLKDTVELMKLANQEGLKGDQIAAYAGFWDDVGDAVGESGTKLAQGATGLRAVGIAAGDEGKALSAFGYITDNTKLSIDDFLGLLTRKGKDLKAFGIDVDDTAAILGVMEKSLGLTGKAAATEFASAMEHSDGSLSGLIEKLGISREEFERQRSAVSASSDVIERNAKIQDDTITSLERWQHKLDEFLFSHGELIQQAADLAPLLLAIGPATAAVTTGYNLATGAIGLFTGANVASEAATVTATGAIAAEGQAAVLTTAEIQALIPALVELGGAQGAAAVATTEAAASKRALATSAAGATVEVLGLATAFAGLVLAADQVVSHLGGVSIFDVLLDKAGDRRHEKYVREVEAAILAAGAGADKAQIALRGLAEASDMVARAEKGVKDAEDAHDWAGLQKARTDLSNAQTNAAEKTEIYSRLLLNEAQAMKEPAAGADLLKRGYDSLNPSLQETFDKVTNATAAYAKAHPEASFYGQVLGQVESVARSAALAMADAGSAAADSGDDAEGATGGWLDLGDAIYQAVAKAHPLGDTLLGDGLTKGIDSVVAGIDQIGAKANLNNIFKNGLLSDPSSARAAAKETVQSFGDAMSEELQGLELEAEFGSAGARVLEAFGAALADPKKQSSIAPAISQLIKEAERSGVPDAAALGQNLVNAISDGLKSGDWTGVYAAMHALADTLSPAAIQNAKDAEAITKAQTAIAASWKDTQEKLADAAKKEKQDLDDLAKAHKEAMEKIEKAHNDAETRIRKAGGKDMAQKLADEQQHYRDSAAAEDKAYAERVTRREGQYDDQVAQLRKGYQKLADAQNAEIKKLGGEAVENMTKAGKDAVDAFADGLNQTATVSSAGDRLTALLVELFGDAGAAAAAALLAALNTGSSQTAVPTGPSFGNVQRGQSPYGGNGGSLIDFSRPYYIDPVSGNPYQPGFQRTGSADRPININVGTVIATDEAQARRAVGDLGYGLRLTARGVA